MQTASYFQATTPPRRAWLRNALVLFGSLGLVGLAVACHRCLRDARHGTPEAEAAERLEPVPVGPQQLRLAGTQTGKPRLLLDEPTLERVRSAAKAKTPVFARLEARCQEMAQKSAKSGYQGWDWADAVANLSLCWHATGEEDYATAAVGYFDALLDDRFTKGDRQGGESVVRHDSGYGIRTFGTYTALGYDWLRKAPGMTPARRKKALERLASWLDWYGQHGYLRDEPISNYYWGYLTTLSFAGLAAAGESPAADRWLDLARNEMLGKRVLPMFQRRLKGGYWPEGFQYGEYTAAEVALVAKAFKTAAGVDLVRQLPWLADTVTYHVYALVPGERSVYDGGTWGEKPAKPSSLALSAIAFALDGVDPRRAAEARFLLRHALPPVEREYAWIGVLGDFPAGSERDPRQGAPLGYHASSAGLSLMRGDWSRSAVWVSLQAGPRLAPDHQENEQGHFELFRGSDGLLIDGGSSEGSATINHNTLLIDDGGRVLNYTPNQGVWGEKVRTSAFGDDGRVAVVVGEIGDAYLPKCATEGCSKRAVERLIRTLVFVRPSLLVIDDRVELADESYGAVWAAHSSVAPVIDGQITRVVVGGSRADLQTLEPYPTEIRALREPTPSGEGPHRLNQPWGPMWRLEVASPRGSDKRRFLHVITSDEKSKAPERATRLSGEGLQGARAKAGERSVAVLIASSAEGGKAKLVAPIEEAIIAGLEANASYDLREADCNIEARRAPQGRKATSAGFLRVRIERCQR